MTQKVSFELHQNRQKSNKVSKILPRFNDYVLWSLYVLICFFLDRGVNRAVMRLLLEQ